MNLNRALKILEDESTNCTTADQYSVVIFKLDNFIRSHKHILEQHRDKEKVKQLYALLAKCVEEHQKLSLT